MLSENAALWHCTAHFESCLPVWPQPSVDVHACRMIVLTSTSGIPRLGVHVYLARLSWHHVSSAAHLHEHPDDHECHVC